MTEPADAVLIRSIIQGDTRAFRALLLRHEDTAYRFAYRLCRDVQEAEDLVQDAFLRVWRYQRRLKPEARFTTLLYTMTSRLWIDKQRRPSSRGEKLTLDQQTLVSEEPGPEDQMLQADQMDRLHRLVMKLSPRQRLVFTLRDIEGLSIREVQDVTGLSAGSVKTNLYLARKSLRKSLLKQAGKS